MRSALEGLEGVSDVDVDFGAKTATCKIDPTTIDTDKVLAAVKGAGEQFGETSLIQ